MTNRKRFTPYAQKARQGSKKSKKNSDYLTGEIQADTSNAIARIEIMNAEELANLKQIAGQNALKLFNNQLEEIAKRIPKMNDEVLVTSLLAVWDKVGGKK